MQAARAGSDASELGCQVCPHWRRGHFRRLRQDLGRDILLGLIVLIRTFLSMALQVELEGRWPWQRDRANVSPP
nr:DUF1622 domain-containing protein [Allochromatium palmeri]